MHDDSCCLIPLRRRDGSIRAEAKVDREDYDRLAEHSWNLTRHGYADRRIPGGHLKMHRVILGLERGDGLEVDHINRDKLDNRRSNLRVATHAQNHQNRVADKSERATSKYRGVCLDRSRGLWMARVRTKQIGRFPTELEAARAAETYRRKHLPFAEPDPALAAA